MGKDGIMEEIIEHYGEGLLQLIGGAGMLALARGLLMPQGVWHLWIEAYLQGIAG